MSQITITTESHDDIQEHVIYAMTRTSKHTWQTVELDRHPYGNIHPDKDHERTAIHEATVQHHGTFIPGTDTATNTTTSTVITPTAYTTALVRMKAQPDELTTRGQTIIDQIRADRARRKAAMNTTRATRSRGLLTDPARSIFA